MWITAALLLAVVAPTSISDDDQAAQAAREAPMTDREPPGHSPDFSPARPGEAAVREEFQAAERIGTVEAWDLFLARHPDSGLAGEARLRRAAAADD